MLSSIMISAAPAATHAPQIYVLCTPHMTSTSRQATSLTCRAFMPAILDKVVILADVLLEWGPGREVEVQARPRRCWTAQGSGSA